MNLQDLLDACAESAKTKGFNPDFPAFVALAHTELSEALEEFRAGHEVAEVYYPNLITLPAAKFHYNADQDSYDVDAGVFEQARAKTAGKPEGIPAELADVVIRIAHFCGAHGIDLVNAIETKKAYNKTRPHMHGKKL